MIGTGVCVVLRREFVAVVLCWLRIYGYTLK